MVIFIFKILFLLFLSSYGSLCDGDLQQGEEYIDDLLDNIYLFDPYSADDIARNVINCLKDIENKRALDPKLKFLVPETKEFIESL